MRLKTERLVLRMLRPADAEWIAREIANPDVHKWLTSVPYPYGRRDGDFFVDKFKDNPGVRAILKEDEPLGVISIISAARLDASRPDALELGYWLRAKAWGKGYMTEACRRMILWYSETGSGTLNSGWIEGNERSSHVLRKLGFQETGETHARRSHFHGKDVPVIRVSLPEPRVA
ncbi:GNAT family N-acetyltransferase [Cognatishimia maritima]|uniref:Protein N-acetyltransferase, RimJ/RimL family n=1 Tax=Cognatishimia maritima TaxID=870908 RepID=A0A1M5IGD7_9RHOB|nr:GNAT family N-acetyltransferase [Cognatishimia maritima]SHG27306.1 Protein N-acetyltransferase, RimJ/RimL family [Cognatishimia maritima]